MLHVERAAGESALEKLAPEWEKLEEGLLHRTPFTSPLWNALWWKHFSAAGAWVRDELYVHTVRNDSDALVAVAPLMLTVRPAFGPVQLRALQLLGADENVTELRSVICRPDDLPEALATLSRYFRTEADDWDWLQWGGIPLDGSSRDVLGRNGKIHWGRQVPRYYVPLQTSWEGLKSRLSRNMKEALRKCYNSLGRAGHDFTFRVIGQSEHVAAALENFFELHAERSRAVRMPLHANVFARQSAREFMLEYGQRMAERDQLRIFQLVIDGEIIATRVGFVLGNDLYLYYSGYRVAWAQYSVMTTVVAEAIQWAIAQGLRSVDLSTGRDISKLRWRPREIVSCEAVQSSPGRLRQFAADTYHRVAGRATPNTVIGRLLSSARRSRL